MFLWRLAVHRKGADDKIGRTTGMGLIQPRGGKIVEHRSAWATLKFFQGLGLVPALSVPGAQTGQPSARPGA